MRRLEGHLDYYSDSIASAIGCEADIKKDLALKGQLLLPVIFDKAGHDDIGLTDVEVQVAPLVIKTPFESTVLQSENGDHLLLTFNSKWFTRQRWIVYEALAHQLIHGYQGYARELGIEARKKADIISWHDLRFIDLSSQIGLNVRLGKGNHFTPASGVFEEIMKSQDIPQPPKVIVTEQGRQLNWWEKIHGKIRGTSTLALYENSACNRKPVCKLRLGRSDLNLICGDCGGQFKLVSE